MAKKEAHISSLQHYLPQGTYEAVVAYLQYYKVHLTVTRERKTILGDYRHRTFHQNHRISVNGNLNPYAFLITLLHELAHLLAFENFGSRIQPHGREWKQVFGKLLASFIEQKVFPEDIHQTLLNSIQNPAASSCSDEILLRILKRYDPIKDNKLFIESIPVGSLFKTDDGKIFRKGEQLRKRFKCEEVKTRKVYLFSPVYEVEVVE